MWSKLLPYMDFLEEFLLESYIDNRPQNPAPTVDMLQSSSVVQKSHSVCVFLFEM